MGEQTKHRSGVGAVALGLAAVTLTACGSAPKALDRAVEGHGWTGRSQSVAPSLHSTRSAGSAAATPSAAPACPGTATLRASLERAGLHPSRVLGIACHGSWTAARYIAAYEAPAAFRERNGSWMYVSRATACKRPGFPHRLHHYICDVS